MKRANLGWDALLSEFRALGGTVENIVLRHDSKGRGMFSVDPAKSVHLRVPPNLLVRIEDTEIRDGQLVVKASASVGERERSFFDRYQLDFSWGAGVRNDLWQMQLAWSDLPQHVQDALKEMWPIGGARFSKPSEKLCFKRYLETRSVMYRQALFVMPIMEFVNHSSKVARFNKEDGVSLSGVFSKEVLVSYNDDDCWGTALGHGFCEARNYAHCFRCTFKFEGIRIEIFRRFDEAVKLSGGMEPIVRAQDGNVSFSFLTLGNTISPHQPRAVFLNVTKNTPIKRPDRLFDLIQHYNRMKLLRFLRRSEGPSTPLSAMLRRAAYEQSETLSSNW